MSNDHNFLVCQIQAVTEFAVSHHDELDLGKLLDALLAAASQIEHGLAWRKNSRWRRRMNLSVQQLAAALGGEVAGRQVLAPGPATPQAIVRCRSGWIHRRLTEWSCITLRAMKRWRYRTMSAGWSWAGPLGAY